MIIYQMSLMQQNSLRISGAWMILRNSQNILLNGSQSKIK